jgi:hypothetical protein
MYLQPSPDDLIVRQLEHESPWRRVEMIDVDIDQIDDYGFHIDDITEERVTRCVEVFR